MCSSILAFSVASRRAARIDRPQRLAVSRANRSCSAWVSVASLSTAAGSVLATSRAIAAPRPSSSCTSGLMLEVRARSADFGGQLVFDRLAELGQSSKQSEGDRCIGHVIGFIDVILAVRESNTLDGR